MIKALVVTTKQPFPSFIDNKWAVPLMIWTCTYSPKRPQELRQVCCKCEGCWLQKTIRLCWNPVASRSKKNGTRYPHWFDQHTYKHTWQPWSLQPMLQKAQAYWRWCTLSTEFKHTFRINVVHMTSWSWFLSTPRLHMLTSTCLNNRKVIVHHSLYTKCHFLSLHSCQVWYYLPDVRLILSKCCNNINCRCFLCACLIFSLCGAVGPINAQHMWSQQKVKATASWKDTMQAS